MKTYDAGTAIYLTAQLFDVASSNIDPDSIKITVTDSAGTAKVTAQDMTKTSLGNYGYIWQSSESDLRGVYQVKIKAVKGSYTTINNISLFNME